jgi:hypothetical protein
VCNDILRYWKHIHRKIDFNNNATIMPFAQKEMVSVFIEGVAPDYQEEIERYLRNLVKMYPNLIIDSIEELDPKQRKNIKEKFIKTGEKVLNGHLEELKNFRTNNYISPVMSIVSMLPKDELAIMAESLINLTSFKKKVTLEEETVSEPIDVALISKGDGFIWIKRKHYFAPELNPHFFANYYKKVIE